MGDKYMKTIQVTEETYKRIKQDKEEFQKLIGGGIWSDDDTLIEYFKIMDGI